MRTLYMRNLLKDIWEKRVVIAIVVMACVVLSGFMGYRKASGQRAELNSPEYQEKVEEYEAALKEYDTLIKEFEDTIPTAEEQAKKQKEYCENSIYMQLDPQHISVSTAQYAMQTTEANVNLVLPALAVYINDGGLKKELAEADETISEEYLREIISCSYLGNVLTVSVMHGEPEQSEELLQAVCKQVEIYAKTLIPVYGDFQLGQIDTTTYEKADITVTNGQNTALGALRTYEASVSDARQKLINQKSAKTAYETNSKPEAPEYDGLLKTLLKYMIFGFILGAVLAVAVLLLKYVLSDRLRSKGELLAAELPVLGELYVGKGYRPSLERSLMDIALLAEKSGNSKVFLNVLSDGTDSRKAAEEYRDEMTRNDLQAEIGYSAGEDAGELKRMIAAGNCVFVVEFGKTGFKQLEEQRELCRKFGVSIWGYITVG